MGKYSFQSKPRPCDPSNGSSQKNEPCFEVSTHIYGVTKEIDGKMFIGLSFVIGNERAL